MGICFVTPLVFFRGVSMILPPLPRCLKYIYICIYIYIHIFIFISVLSHLCKTHHNQQEGLFWNLFSRFRADSERHLNGGLLPATGWFPISTNDWISSTTSPRTKNSPQHLALPPISYSQNYTFQIFLAKKKTKEVDTLITSQPENPRTRDHQTFSPGLYPGTAQVKCWNHSSRQSFGGRTWGTTKAHFPWLPWLVAAIAGRSV